MKGINSPTLKLTHVVPKSFISGPMLLDLYINDLIRVVTFQVILYAK